METCKRFFPIIFLGVSLVFLLSLNLACAKKTQVKEDRISGEIMGKGPKVESEMKLAATPSPGQVKMDTEKVKESALEEKPFKDFRDWKTPLKESSATTETTNLSDIHFEFDKYSLTEAAQQILTKNAAILKDKSNLEVLIEGHADERGTDEYNLALGEKRAMAAKNYLVTLGIDPNRIFTISYGEEKPVDPGHAEVAWAKNRRAHFVITSK